MKLVGFSSSALFVADLGVADRINLGISPQALDRIAGADGCIRGEAEWQQLGKALSQPNAISILQRAQRPIERYTLTQFLSDHARGGFLVDAVNWDRLSALGLDRARVMRVAGGDHQIHGERDLRELFQLLDALDRNGDSRSFDKTIGTTTTPAGAALALLREGFRVRDVSPAERTIDDALQVLSVKDVSIPIKLSRQGNDDSCFRHCVTMLPRRRADQLSQAKTGHYMAKTAVSGRDFSSISGFSKDFSAGLAYIDACLDRQWPCIVGVAHSSYNPNPELDGITGHFVVIKGRHTDAEGRLYYDIADPAQRAGEERLYVDSGSHMLFKLRNDDERGWVDGRPYQVTHVRLYNDLDFASVTGAPPAAAPA